MARRELPERSGSIVGASKRQLSALLIVAGLVAMCLALGARAKAAFQSRGSSARRRTFQHQRAVVPIASRVPALQLRPVPRVLDGEVRRCLRPAEHRGLDPVPHRARTRPATTCSYLNANAAFIQGGSYGDVKNSIGPFVAKVNPKTLRPMWYTQLVNTVQTGEWDFPAGMAIENNGFIYVVSGYRIFKVDPTNGKVVKTLKLPTHGLHAQQLPRDTGPI